MVNYYYDKFNAIETVFWVQQPWGTPIRDVTAFLGKSKGYTFNASNNTFQISSDVWKVGERVNVGSHAYSMTGDFTLRRYIAINNPLAEAAVTCDQYIINTINSTQYTEYSRGILVSSNIIAEDGTYPTNGRHSDGYWYVRGRVANTVPTTTLTSPVNNLTLYENDVMSVIGTAYDADADQSVTVYYQINSEQRKVLATNISQTQISLSKQLTFRSGKLFDGDSVITGALADGVAHTLKVWAQDSDGAQSATVERTFYVVPNRAPILSIDTIVPNGIIDTDQFKISGTASDLDANSNVTVTHRINGGNVVEIYNGTGGAWEFDVTLAQLVVGENTIVIEVIDNYSAKASKTIKLNKNKVKTPILQSVARYKIEPPRGSAKGVLLWIQRDVDLDLTVELSMTLVGEQEQYVILTADHTAPVATGIVEDEFYYEADEQKNNIILKLSTSRSSINVDHKIHLISGVLE